MDLVAGYQKKSGASLDIPALCDRYRMQSGQDWDRVVIKPKASSGGKKAEWVEMTRKEMRESGLIPTDAPSGSRLVQIGDTQYKLDSIRKVGPSLH